MDAMTDTPIDLAFREYKERKNRLFSCCKKFDKRKKFKLSREEKLVDGIRVYRIRHFYSDKPGGFVQREDNLSHIGQAWISEDACVYGNARVSGNATVKHLAQVSGEAIVCGNAKVLNRAKVCDYAFVSGSAVIRYGQIVKGFRMIFGSKRSFGKDRKIHERKYKWTK